MSNFCMPVYNYIYQQTNKYLYHNLGFFSESFAIRKTNRKNCNGPDNDMLTKFHFEKGKTGKFLTHKEVTGVDKFLFSGKVVILKHLCGSSEERYTKWAENCFYWIQG